MDMCGVFIVLLYYMYYTGELLHLILITLFLPSIYRVLSQYICFPSVLPQVPLGPEAVFYHRQKSEYSSY